MGNPIRYCDHCGAMMRGITASFCGACCCATFSIELVFTEIEDAELAVPADPGRDAGRRRSARRRRRTFRLSRVR